MEILIYPTLDYVCAACGYHMLVQKSDIYSDEPLQERIVQCVNEKCKFYNRKAKVKPISVEMEEV